MQSEGRIDLLVNNAGISVETRVDMLGIQEEGLDRLMNVNLKGPYFLTQSISRLMIDLQSKELPGYQPKIVNIYSLTSYANAATLAEYALSKVVVSMMTRLFAARLAKHHINVYEVRPGIIRTDMTRLATAKYDRFIDQGGLPIPHWGLPEDVAKAVAALALGYLPYSTGEIINVDGGFH